MTLQEIQPKLKDVQSKALEKVDISNSKFFMIKVRGAKEEELKATKAEDTTESRLVSEVLKEYGNVFGELTQLPPSRVVFDHHIPL